MTKPPPYDIHNLPTEDPPDGYGSMMPFAMLPDYMQTVLRIQWAAESDDVKRRARDNSANWIKMGRPDHHKVDTPYKRVHTIDPEVESTKKRGGKRAKQAHPSSDVTTIESE